jgi:hypothetical protein
MPLFFRREEGSGADRFDGGWNTVAVTMTDHTGAIPHSLASRVFKMCSELSSA